MRKILVAAAALAAAIAFARPADAQTLTNYSLIDSAQHNFRITTYYNPTTMQTTPASVSADSAGNPLSGTIGLSNPNGTALYVQGVTNGVPLLTAFAAPQHIICDSGCGGGGGGGAVFGPTAVGTANANPPVMIGGTADGTATGAVGILKVLGGSAFINCANCSGSGISVAFGGAIGSVGTPGGFKDGSGNFQALIGDTTNGQKVNLGGTLPAFASTPTVNIGTAPTIAVTGTFFQATQPVSAASLPLPAGAATQTTSAAILSALGSPFQAGGSIGNTTFGATQPTASALNATVVGTGTFAVQLTGATNNINNIAGTISLPTGAATSALQSTGNSSLATIATNTPALGQALAAGSVPVVLTAAQITTLTPLSTVTVTQGTGTNLHVVCDSGCAGSGGTSATFGATFPTIGTPVGFSQGGNFVAATGTSGNLNVQCANCSGSGVSTADEAAWTAGSSVFVGIGGAYQTTATSNPLTSGQQGFAQLTINRALHINLRNSTGVEIGNSTTPIQVSLANTASSATAIGTVNPTTAANWGIGATGSAVPANGVLGMMSNAGTAVALQGDGTNGLWVNVKTALGLAAGSTTSGQTGSLIMGAVTTAAPSYTTAQTNYLSLTTGGAMRSDLASLAGTALGAPANFGTTPGAVASLGVNASLFQGTAIISLTNPTFASVSDGTTKAKVEPASTPAAVTDAALAVAPIPSELHVAEVGSNQISVAVSPTVTASAYSAGNAIGVLQTIAGAARVSGTNGASGTGGVLGSMMLTVKSVQSTQVDVFIFNANPSGSTCTDKSAFVLAAADAAKLVGVLSVPSTAANGAGWYSGGTGSLGMPIYYPLTYSLSSATSLFACAVARGAFTPASTTDVTFNYNILRD